MVVRELFAKLGLDVDEGPFLKGSILISGLRDGLDLLGRAFNLTIKPIVDTVAKTAEFADRVDETSQALGWGVEALQAFEYGASLTGIGASELAGALRILNRQSTEAISGTESAAEAFTALGVSLTSGGQLKTGEELIGDIADRFKGMPDGARKTALAMEIFGRSGANLIPVLNGGREKLAEFNREARELGAVMSGDEIKAAAEFSDDMDRAKVAATGLGRAIGGPLIKVLRPMLTDMLTWIRLNRTVVASKIAGFVNGLAGAIRFAGSVIGFFASFNLSNLVAALSIVALGFLAVKGAAIGAAIASIGAWVMATWPILLMIGAIALVVLAIEDFYQFLSGGESVIGRFARPIIDFFHETIPNAITTAITWWKDGIVGFFSWLVSAVPAALKGIWGGLKDGLLTDIADTFGLSAVFGGGAASPVAAAAQTVSSGAGTVVAPTMTANITVNAQTGASPEQIGQGVNAAMEDFNRTLMRETAAAVAGG